MRCTGCIVAGYNSTVHFAALFLHCTCGNPIANVDSGTHVIDDVFVIAIVISAIFFFSISCLDLVWFCLVLGDVDSWVCLSTVFQSFWALLLLRLAGLGHPVHVVFVFSCYSYSCWHILLIWSVLGVYFRGLCPWVSLEPALGGLTGLTHVLVFAFFALNHSWGITVGNAVGDIGTFADSTSD